MPAIPAIASTGRPRRERGLVMAPFRGLRYAADRVSDLGAVTSPPYDVIDAEAATHLEDLDPHNVVRLILPRDDGDPAPGGRYRHAAERLASWVAAGVLRADERATLYVYEQVKGDLVQRGLIGAVELREPEERVILPHEDVMPGPVADRLELMRATSANLEPILLVYDGGGGDTVHVIDAVTSGTPLLAATSEDGTTHRLWAVQDESLVRRITDDLGPRQALIADGHHRYATYRRLQAEHRAAGHGDGPWDLGLALLVDSSAYPLHVAAIHRVIEGLPLDRALEQASPGFRVTGAGGTLDLALASLVEATGSHPFLVTDGLAYYLLSDPDPGLVAAALPPHHSTLWRGLDASVLHGLLLERLWHIEDGSPRTRYVHDTQGAVQAAARSSGTAVLLRPVDVADVLAVAARGERMPRKSTSFGPKPRTGFVLRPLAG